MLFTISKLVKLLAVTAVFIFISSTQSFAHCDGLDGPVVKDARKALESGNVKLVLIWVKQEYQEEIITSFNKTLEVRKLSPQAKEFADMYFFETLVRVHRAGEGAPYTGIKPAGRDLGPAIPAADKAIETGSPKELIKFLDDAIHEGLHPLYMSVKGKRNFDPSNVEAGREYVKAYVEYVHYVEKVYQLKSGAAHGEEGSEAHAH
ncbi:MAG: hypothetical protein A2279_05665 [Stygiobacter sp. RIFOXYA12_FULL_38_9]|nr:MAG: hypothetical protein A2X62_07445 [Stygiobacter sp. GWC2_38_9]OGU83951.1 MAG: hypothetical protein A2279_05665 [Stygiobacter sp. RIFOXYA12_FULL_38_9]OGV09312.1 MAG: hypothetical protein A2299_15560 [Stygiobacter sp. RIFOXYB2_FULL_37_11]OGV11746.1 MAG: hypothetical protein A2237_08735 [Stygiobacter sp. RIFOXYA2_FULL_38_8]OGV16559.1 MAG: hypothetical protein A2440_02445 [Stygiobacter sp. RIFOXYC2_FULL_38_25]OGV79859.1 MAG: hypothetical protein A2X65_09880 [Stygiobacter sp. GWF2_38_21]RJQ